MLYNLPIKTYENQLVHNVTPMEYAMSNQKKINLIISLFALFLYGNSFATATSPSTKLQLAHNLGYGHYHGTTKKKVKRSGRIRSYQYCSENVFKPCRKKGYSYIYCNRQHHYCSYGHLRNCIRGKTC